MRGRSRGAWGGGSNRNQNFNFAGLKKARRKLWPLLSERAAIPRSKTRRDVSEGRSGGSLKLRPNEAKERKGGDLGIAVAVA